MNFLTCTDYIGHYIAFIQYCYYIKQEDIFLCCDIHSQLSYIYKYTVYSYHLLIQINQVILSPPCPPPPHTQTGCMYIFGGVTVIEHMRTSSVYRVWLQPPPSLKELCWSWIIDHVPRIGKLSKEKLLQLGIPHDYVWRIAQSLEPGVCA